VCGRPLERRGGFVVCVSYLDARDASARIRAAIRRVRRQTPSATVLAGLWGPNQDESGEIRGELNGNPWARSFCDAVNRCIETAAASRRLPEALWAKPARLPSEAGCKRSPKPGGAASGMRTPMVWTGRMTGATGAPDLRNTAMPWWLAPLTQKGSASSGTN
jgi:hypothetical protein